MEIAVLQNFFENHVRGVDSHLTAIVTGFFQGRDVVDLDATDALEHEHARGGVFPIHMRHMKERLTGEVGPEAVRIPPFQAIVQLVVQRVGEIVGFGDEVMELPFGRALSGGCKRLQDFNVSRNRWLDVWLLHFDDHLGAIGQCGSVHLTQRGCSERFGVDRCKNLLWRASQFLSDYVSDVLPGHGRHCIMQFAELDYIGPEQQVWARR